MSAVVKPRLKVTAACEACRRKKSRCDGIAPCSHCVKAGAECVFPAEPVKRGPKKGAKYRKRGTVDVDDPQRAAKRTKSDEPTLAHRESAPRPGSAPPLHALPAMDVPPEIVLHLVEMFFSHVNAQAFPILHQPSFLALLHARAVHAPLLYAICAAASPFSTHPRVLAAMAEHRPAEPPSVPPVAGEGWASTARQLLRTDPSLLYSLQGVHTLLVLSLFALAAGHAPRAWQDLATATRTSQLLAFDDERVPPPSNTLRELVRRVVWATYSTEVVLAAGARSSSLLAPLRPTSPLPMLGHLERGLRPHEFALAGDDEVPVAHVDGGRIVHSVHLCGVEPFLVRAVDIWARVQSFIDARRLPDSPPRPSGGVHFGAGREERARSDWDAKSDFASLSLELNAWSMRLPVPFLFNPKVIEGLPDAQLQSYYQMHVLHHLAQIALHRATGESIFAQSCHAKAVTHAISLARVLVSLTKSGIFALSPIAGFAAFTGATALLFDCDVRGATAGSQSLQFFLRYLVTGMSYFSPLKKLHATLVHLIQIHQSPPPATTLAAPPAGFEPFFTRYAAWAILEPSLAPIPTTFAPAPRPAPCPSSSSSSSSHSPPANFGGYISDLRDLIAAQQSSAEAGGDPVEEESLLAAAVLARHPPPPPPPAPPLIEAYSPAHPALYPLPDPDPRFIEYTQPRAEFDEGGGGGGTGGLPELTDPAEMFDWLTHAPVGGNFWELDQLAGFLEGAGGGEEGGGFTWMGPEV